MKKLIAIITIFISFNVFANNMKPMPIAYYAQENKTDLSFYTEKMNASEIEAFKACHLSEKEINFIYSQGLLTGAGGYRDERLPATDNGREICEVHPSWLGEIWGWTF